MVRRKTSSSEPPQSSPADIKRMRRQDAFALARLIYDAYKQEKKPKRVSEALGKTNTTPRSGDNRAVRPSGRHRKR